MKVILDTPENNTSTLAAFDAFGVVVLTAAGREFNDDGHLISIGGNSVTKTFDIVHKYSLQLSYITHPEAFRGRWDDQYVDGLIGLIPDTATIDFDFTPTAEAI